MRNIIDSHKDKPYTRHGAGASLSRRSYRYGESAERLAKRAYYIDTGVRL